MQLHLLALGCVWTALLPADLQGADPPASSLSRGPMGDPGLIRSTALNPTTTNKAGFTFLAPDQTGITFTNTLNDLASAENRVLNNGSGVAAGDFDNDGRVDLFFCSLDNGDKLFRNLGQWRFEDVTAASGLRFKPGYHRGAVFADVNGDGWLDLLVGTANNGVLCFLNDGHGRFADATAEAGTASPFATETLALADVDGNGTLDLYVANNRTDDIRDWPRIPVMFVNKKPVVPPELANRLVFDHGQLQEFGEPDILYRNDGRGHFTAVSWTNGVFLDERGQPLARPPLDWGLTASFRDLNGDGAPDLYVCNDYWTPDRLWLNTGDGRFRAAPPLALRHTSSSSMGVDFADINRDGYLDFFVVDMLSRSPELRKRQMIARRPIPTRIGEIDNRPQAPQNTLFLNRGDGTFAEIACLAGLAASEWSWSPVFLDVDLDGYDDLLITAGHIHDIQDFDATEQIRARQDSWRRSADGTDLQRAFVEAKREHAKLYPPLDAPLVAFHNLGNLRFEETTGAWGLNVPGVNHGIALADLDNDGDLDVVVNRLGAPAGVWRNDASAPRVAVRLRGQPPNTQAIGAKVSLLGAAVSNQTSEVTAGGSYMSGSDTLRVLAPGLASQHLSLRVTWRDGSATEVSNVQPNRLYEIPQPGATRASNSVARAREPAPMPLFQDVSQLLAHTHHEDVFDDFQRQPLLPRKLSQSGPGACWFDVNQDGWDDLLIGSGKGGTMALFLNREGMRFERASSAPFDAPVMRDQTTILGLSLGGGRTRLLVGSASYEDGDTNQSCVLAYDFPARPSVTDFPGHTSSVGPLALADIDGDGDLDLFVGGQVIPGQYPRAASSLLFRQADGRWTLDVEASRALSQAGLVNGAVWSDLDNDGFPELILACEWGPIRVYHNQAGNLREVTREWGLAAHTGLWTGVTTGDFDGDGRLDIVAGNWGFNSLYQASAGQPMVLYFGDLAGTGATDILETDWDPARQEPVPRHLRETMQAALPFLAERFPTHRAWSRATITDVAGQRAGQLQKLSVSTLASTVFLNRQGRFEARPLPLEAQMAPVFSVNAADLDGDGIEDLFVTQNFFAFRNEEARLDGGRSLWLRGDGRGNLLAVPGQTSGLLVYGEQRGAALADFNHDARTDLVVTQNGADTRLFQNTGARPGLRVRLQGPAANPDGVGAVLRLRFPTGWGPAREIHAGDGYWSQSSPTAVLGLREPPLALQIRWPGGKTFEHPVPDNAREVVIGNPAPH